MPVWENFLPCVWGLMSGSTYAANLGEFENATDVGLIKLKGSSEFLPDTGRIPHHRQRREHLGQGGRFPVPLEKDLRRSRVRRGLYQWIGPGEDEASPKAYAMVRQDLEADSPYVDAAIHGDGLIGRNTAKKGEVSPRA